MEETLDFSQTQRIIFLIDLHPLFNNLNPNSYISSILSSSQTLLTFPPLSSSLFTFKFFFSSLSPLLSSSKLRSLFGKSSPFFSFDHPSETLASLSEALNSLGSLSESSISSPKAFLTASSLCQLMHDYIWEPQVEDILGKPKCPSIVRSNLIVVFSPVSRSLECLASYVDIEGFEGTEVNVFCRNFGRVFNSVKEGLVSRDIHCTWVDVNCEAECVDDKLRKDQTLIVFEKGVKSLGWGFSSTDAISLGSALMPFGMIYPNIGCCLVNFCPIDCGIKGRAELSLTITDVSGKPLECNCCDLELVHLKHLSGPQRHEDITSIWESSCSSVVDLNQETKFQGSQIMKICVKEVWKNIGNLKLKGVVHDYVLLRGSSTEHKVSKQENTSGGFLADKVLEMLCMETTEFTPSKPIWPMLLNFLYRNDYWALVSFSSGDDESLFGILKPFTVHSAIVSIDRSTSKENHGLDGLFPTLVEIVTVSSCEVPTGKIDGSEANNLTGSQLEALSQTKSSDFQCDKKKSHRKFLRSFKDLSWSSFREASLRNTKLDLEDVYFARECKNSKKLMFLKCWMKQTKKSSRCFQMKPTEPKSNSVEGQELIESRAGSEHENERPGSSSFSNEEPSLFAPSNTTGEAIPVSCSEAFIDCIPQKIQQGLESKEVDLSALAERLVESSIYWLCLKHEKKSSAMNSSSEEQVEDRDKTIATELLKHLLKEPKDLAMKYKVCDSRSSASELSFTSTSEEKVREYELQILFRMEILRSKVEGIEEIAKKKMVKQICLLLDGIQYHLEGGCFGDVSLDKYVGRTIKTRYSHCLGDVVDRIYSKMDLLLCNNDDAVSGSQINSEDGGEAQRQKTVHNEMGESGSGSGSGSASTSGSNPLKLKESFSASPQEIRDMEQEECSLMEAQEKRERASRFKSFARHSQYLQRVWAPKQPKAMKAKTDSLRKFSKRKARKEVYSDVVCETPMTEKKRSCQRESTGNEQQKGYELKNYRSVSKALFQDDNNA